MSLGSPSCENWINRKNNVISSFAPKVYGQNRCPDLFNGNLRNRKGPIIRPSQLNLCKNVTQSSWVAGGYWQSPVHSRDLPVAEVPQEMSAATAFTPLSRSSSQSSGFVSQSSQPGVYDGATGPPNSHTGSICGAEFDRLSALSEPIYSRAATAICCPAARPGSIIGTSYFGGPPVITQQSYSVVPHLHGFLPNYGPLPQPVPCYYPPQLPHHPSPIWNQAADAHSRCSSQDLNDSRGSSAKNGVKCRCVRRHRTLVSVVHENLFLAFLFGSSLLFNMLILGYVMFGNSSIPLLGLLS